MPGPTVRLTPAQRKKWSVVDMVIAADVVQLNVYFVTVVVRAVPPVAVQSRVPLSLFKNTLNRGNIVPKFADLLMKIANDTDVPDPMMPPVFGTPACVSNRFETNSAGDPFFISADASAVAVASGPAVFN